MGIHRVEIEISTRLRVNQPRTVRQVIGQALSRLAERIDGRRHLAVELECFPALTREQRDRCIRDGFRAISAAARVEQEGEAEDMALRMMQPGLYADGP